MGNDDKRAAAATTETTEAATSQLRSRGWKAAVTAGVLATLLVGGGAAFAAWTASARGGVDARVLENVEASITGIAPMAALYPGASQPISFRITNPNPYPVRYNVANVHLIRAAGYSGRVCSIANFQTIGRTTDLSIDVPANGSADATIPGAIRMLASADDSCQGATVSMNVDLHGMQVTG